MPSVVGVGLMLLIAPSTTPPRTSGTTLFFWAVQSANEYGTTAPGRSAAAIWVPVFSSIRLGCTVHDESSSTPCWALERPRIFVSKNDSVPDPVWGRYRMI